MDFWDFLGFFFGFLGFFGIFLGFLDFSSFWDFVGFFWGKKKPRLKAEAHRRS